MHADWNYEAGGPEYQSSDEDRREYRQRSGAPKLLNRKKKKTRTVDCAANRRRNKHWSW